MCECVCVCVCVCMYVCAQTVRTSPVPWIKTKTSIKIVGGVSYTNGCTCSCDLGVKV